MTKTIKSPHIKKRQNDKDVNWFRRCKRRVRGAFGWNEWRMRTQVNAGKKPGESGYRYWNNNYYQSFSVIERPTGKEFLSEYCKNMYNNKLCSAVNNSQ